jgi:DNA helicase-2/ATP-dependent DNA helicase PcrA
MILSKFLSACTSLPGRTAPPDNYQVDVISHGTGPLWVVAGPGSGKTDSMALRCLKLMIVDKVPPRAIVVTTFTEKAARNLEERIALYMQYFSTKFSELQGIDYSRLRVGTLHAICNDVMQEFRFIGYQNYRLLTDMEQRLFIMEHSSFAGMGPPPAQSQVWDSLPYLATGYDPVGGGQWRPGSGHLPNRWVRARATQTLFNRIVEDHVDTTKMRAAGGHWASIADAYDEYSQKLFGYHRCDFAHLQTKFLEFLGTHQSKLFMIGDGTDQFPGIRHVLVDEYQDTNPIQEKIYLKLAEPSPHNLCVVGDDDQALYRFRGGTVECMVNLPAALKREGLNVGALKPSPLPVNYRSHDSIVKFCDEFMGSFAVMSQTGARARESSPYRPGPG